MKIKMTTSAMSIKDSKAYYHNIIYTTGIDITDELAKTFIECNYADIIETDIPLISIESSKSLVSLIPSKSLESIELENQDNSNEEETPAIIEESIEKPKRGRKKKVDINED